MYSHIHAEFGANCFKIVAFVTDITKVLLQRYAGYVFDIFWGRGECTTCSSSTNDVGITCVICLHKHAKTKLQTKFQVYQANIKDAMVFTVST